MPQKRYEELLEYFQTSAKDWLEKIPEARGLMLVVDWETGQSDFPPCTLISKEINEHSILECMRQAVKLVEHLSQIFNKQLDSASSVLAKAQKLISEQTGPDS